MSNIGLISPYHAILCFGVRYPKGYEFPWDKPSERKNGKFYDHWWAFSVLRYKPEVELFDDSGNWINGVEPSKDVKEKYFNDLEKFLEENPPPFRPVNPFGCRTEGTVLAIPNQVYCFNERIEEIDPKHKIFSSVKDSDIGYLVRNCMIYCPVGGYDAKWWIVFNK